MAQEIGMRRNPSREETKKTIKLFLSSGAKQFSEIKTHLVEKGLTYSKPGLILILNELISGVQIVKKDGLTFPMYELTNRGIRDYAIKALIFHKRARDIISVSKELSKNRDRIENALESNILELGIYTLFTGSEYWRLRYSKKQKEADAWKESAFLDSLTVKNLGNLVASISKNESEYLNNLTRIENYLELKYPETIIALKKVLADLSTAKNFRVHVTKITK